MRNNNQKAGQALREQGYLSSVDIAKQYQVDVKTARKRMGKPCQQLPGHLGARFWHGDRVRVVFGAKL